MKVLFDHQAYRNQKYGGISLYISKLINGISNYPNNETLITVPKYKNYLLPERTLSNSRLDYWLSDILPITGVRTSNLYSIGSMYLKNYDIFHATYYDTYFLKHINKSKPWIFTYHDLIQEKFEKDYPVFNNSYNSKLKKNKKTLVEKSELIIAISEATKADIVNYYNVDEKKIRVIYHGNPYERLIENQQINLDNYECKRPYLLFVGNREYYKNFTFIIENLKWILLESEIELICAGGGAFNDEESHLIRKCGLQKKILYTEISNNLELLYKNALAFIFPSLYEGFGFPILEAFAMGCPCILSDICVFKEIAGKNNALFFDPRNGKTLEDAVKIIYENSSLRYSLTKNGYERLKLYSWSQTVKNTMDVYNELI